MTVRSFRHVVLGLTLVFALPAVPARAAAVSPFAERSFPATPSLYVANYYTRAITVYSTQARGNVAPQRIISGPLTGLVAPAKLAVDERGNLFVVNGTNILEFDREARGDARPKRVLLLPAQFRAALFSTFTAIAIDRDGTVYAGLLSALAPGQLVGYVLRYVAGAATTNDVYVSGNETNGLTLDAAGTNLLTAANAAGSSCAGTGVISIPTSFAAQEAGILSDPDLCLLQSIVDDSATRTFLLSSTNYAGFFRFSESVVVPPNMHAAAVALAYVTGVPAGGYLALDGSREIFDATGTYGFLNGATDDRITVFAPRANGAAMPLRVIVGPATKLRGISGIAIGGDVLALIRR